jgi:hypothetical protein
MRRQDAGPTQEMCSEEPECNPPAPPLPPPPPPPHHSWRLIGLEHTADMSAEQGAELGGGVRAAAAERQGGK